MRPYSEGSSRCQLSEISGQNASGIFSRLDLAGGRFDAALDLVEGESVIGALVPIAFAVDRVKIESGGFRGQSPVIALGTVDPPHDARKQRRR
jgi:hypothetical protein